MTAVRFRTVNKLANFYKHQFIYLDSKSQTCKNTRNKNNLEWAFQGRIAVFRKFDWSWVVAVGVIAGFVGCGTDDLNNVEIPIVEAENSEEEKITSAMPVQAVTDVSPASTQFQLPGADATPDVVAQKFFEFLNNEDQENFELLLTPVALNAVSRMNFKLPPVTDPNTKIQCTEPRYATIRQKICFVSCKGDTKPSIAQ